MAINGIGRPKKFMPDASYNKTFRQFDELMDTLFEYVREDIKKVKPKERLEFFTNIMDKMIKLTVAERKATNKDTEAAKAFLKNKAMGAFGDLLSGGTPAVA